MAEFDDSDFEELDDSDFEVVGAPSRAAARVDEISVSPAQEQMPEKTRFGATSGGGPSLAEYKANPDAYMNMDEAIVTKMRNPFNFGGEIAGAIQGAYGASEAAEEAARGREGRRPGEGLFEYLSRTSDEAADASRQTASAFKQDYTAHRDAEEKRQKIASDKYPVASGIAQAGTDIATGGMLGKGLSGVRATTRAMGAKEGMSGLQAAKAWATGAAARTGLATAEGAAMGGLSGAGASDADLVNAPFDDAVAELGRDVLPGATVGGAFGTFAGIGGEAVRGAANMAHKAPAWMKDNIAKPLHAHGKSVRFKKERDASSGEALRRVGEKLDDVDEQIAHARVPVKEARASRAEANARQIKEGVRNPELAPAVEARRQAVKDAEKELLDFEEALRHPKVKAPVEPEVPDFVKRSPRLKPLGKKPSMDGEESVAASPKAKARRAARGDDTVVNPQSPKAAAKRAELERKLEEAQKDLDVAMGQRRLDPKMQKPGREKHAAGFDAQVANAPVARLQVKRQGLVAEKAGHQKSYNKAGNRIDRLKAKAEDLVPVTDAPLPWKARMALRAASGFGNARKAIISPEVAKVRAARIINVARKSAKMRDWAETRAARIQQLGPVAALALLEHEIESTPELAAHFEKAERMHGSSDNGFSEGAAKSFEEAAATLPPLVRSRLERNTTSRRRSREEQDALMKQGRGVKNSRHLTGEAFDLGKAAWRGVPKEDYQAVVKAFRDAGWQVLDEGDHYHFEIQ